MLELLLLLIAGCVIAGIIKTCDLHFRSTKGANISKYVKPIFITIACVCMMTSLTHASDMDCFNLEVSQMQLSQAKGLKAKVQAKKQVRQWTLLCNQSK